MSFRNGNDVSLTVVCWPYLLLIESDSTNKMIVCAIVFNTLNADPKTLIFHAIEQLVGLTGPRQAMANTGVCQ